MSRRRRVTKAVLAAVLAAGLIASTARLAATQSTPEPRVITSRKIDPIATVSKRGRQVNVGVFLSCDPVRWLRLRVTVTLVPVGRDLRTVAIAERRPRVRCTGQRQRFPVEAKARKGQHFRRALELTICALAVTRDDARQWCRHAAVGYQATGVRE